MRYIGVIDFYIDADSDEEAVKKGMELAKILDYREDNKAELSDLYAKRMKITEKIEATELNELKQIIKATEL